MLGFLKKLFGFDKETMKDAGVQIEQTTRNTETIIIAGGDPLSTIILEKDKNSVVKEIVPVSAGDIPVVLESPVNDSKKAEEPVVIPREEAKVKKEKPAAMTANKKPRGPKKPQGQKPKAKPAAPKPAAKPQQSKQPAKRGRKPKAG